jgi:uncharacterized membrane protein
MHITVEYIWYFIFYSFIGWVVEVSFQTIKKKVFINRGFLNGPWCPVYGFGMALIIILLSPIKKNIFFLFMGAFILTTILEYITGFVLEKIFSKKWWDYSKEPLNIKGYISLYFSLRWGIGVVLVMNLIHPLLEFFVFYLNNFLGNLLLLSIIISLAADFIVTATSLLKIQKNFIALDDITEKLEEYADEIGFNIYKKVSQAINARETIREKLEEPIEKLNVLIEKYENIREKRSYIQKRLENAYPELKKNIKRRV